MKEMQQFKNSAKRLLLLQMYTAGAPVSKRAKGGGQTEIFTHFPGEILRKLNIFIINKLDVQNLLSKMMLHFRLGRGSY